MNFSVLQEQGFNCYQKSLPPKEDSSLVSLLYPSQMQVPLSSSTAIPPESFQDPFDDPSMEPVPLGPSAVMPKIEPGPACCGLPAEATES